MMYDGRGKMLVFPLRFLIKGTIKPRRNEESNFTNFADSSGTDYAYYLHCEKDSV
jgi:hypothetical protein